MKIYSVRKEEMDIFRWMDPMRMLDRLDLPHYFALTYVLDDPIALLIASVKRNEVAVEWVFVAPGYRRLNVATEMIKYVADRTNGRKLIAHFATDSRKKNVETGPFLENTRFIQTKEDYLRWRIGQREISQKPLFQSSKPKSSNIRRMSELPTYMRMTALRLLDDRQYAITALTPPDVNVAYDPKLSCVVLEDGEPAAVLLLKRSGSQVYPIGVCASRPSHPQQMFVFAKQLLSEENKSGFTVCIDTSEQRAIKLAGQVFETVGNRVYGKVWKRS